MDSELPMLLLLSISLATFVFVALLKQSRSSKRLPPGPRKLPIIGNLHQLGTLPDSLRSLSKVHGPLMLLQLGSIPTLVVSSADAAREIFKTHDIPFSGRPRLYTASVLSYGCSDMVFAPYGEFWKQIKKIVVLELFSLKRVQSFREAREAEVAALLQSVHDSVSSPINFSELALRLSNNLVCRVAFGKKINDDGGDRSRRIHALLTESQVLLGGFCLADFFPSMTWLRKLNGLDKKVQKNFRELDEFYNEVIKEHLDRGRPEPEHEDLVDVLLRVQRDPNQAIALTDDNLKGVLANILFAGSDTSAATLTWTMSELVRNPTVMKRVKDEVREAVGRDRKVEESDIEELVYLKAVVKEGLRLNPPVPLLVPRETTEACTIGDYTIPAKTRVFVDVKSIATDPKYWQDPDKFWPDRFLNSSVDFRGTNFELLPFGTGRRMCPGINFAVQLLELALASLLHGFDWELPQGEDLDMEGEFGLVMYKKVPLRLVAKPVASVHLLARTRITPQ